jgi:ABC-type multidrug transport system fused ATPase/permease subunit
VACRKMDRIVVVKDGQIIEEGSHDLLVKIEDGVYQELWHLQSTGFDVGERETAEIAAVI